MATEPRTTGLTYADLREFPEDNLRRELIDGELIVTAAPALRHQRAVVAFVGAFLEHEGREGGKVFPAPTDVYLSDINVVEPDVVFVTREHASKLEKPFVRGAPDIVVEISSPSTRRLELVRKRELYERYEVPEYWYVDLDADRVEIYRLGPDGYGTPQILNPGERITSALLPGFGLPVAEVLEED